MFEIATKHKPSKGIYSIALKVPRVSKVPLLARKVVEWFDDNNGQFHKYGRCRAGYALAHSQIEDIPYAFFVVQGELVNDFSLEMSHSRNKRNFYFPDRVIYNAKVLEAPTEITRELPQNLIGSDGKPVIVNKSKKISNVISVMEGCLSFPHKDQKLVNRFYRVRVRYQIYRFGILWTRTEWVEGLKAHIFQHEIDHANGINMYYGKKEI